MITDGPTHPSLHINVQLPIASTPPALAPLHHNEASVNTQSSHYSNDLLSQYNEHSQTQQLSQNSDNPSTHKHCHSHTNPPTPPHYIKFSIPVTSNVSDIATTLLHELDSTDLLPECINHQFCPDAPTYPLLLDQKLIFIELLQPLHRPTISTLLNVITTCWPDSFPLHTNTPSTTHQASSICLEPIPTDNWARYCQVSTCTMHNNSHPFIPNTPDGFQSLQIHTQQLRSDIFLELPDTVLNSIGWIRCYERCPNLFLGTADLTSHQQTYPEFQQTHIPDPDFSTNPTWALTFAICPATRTDKLNKLINIPPTTSLLK